MSFQLAIKDCDWLPCCSPIAVRKEASTKCRHHSVCWLSVTELHFIWAHWHQEFWWWLWQRVASESEFYCVGPNWNSLSETNSFHILKTAVLGGDKSSLKVPAFLCLLQMNCLRLGMSHWLTAGWIGLTSEILWEGVGVNRSPRAVC